MRHSFNQKMHRHKMFIIRDKGNVVILFGSLVHPLLINHFDIFDAITSYIACQCLFISFYYSCYYCKMSLIRRKGMVLIMILIITIIVIIALDIILVLVTIYFCMFYHRPCCRCRVVLFVWPSLLSSYHRLKPFSESILNY